MGDLLDDQRERNKRGSNMMEQKCHSWVERCTVQARMPLLAQLFVKAVDDCEGLVQPHVLPDYHLSFPMSSMLPRRSAPPVKTVEVD